MDFGKNYVQLTWQTVQNCVICNCSVAACRIKIRTRVLALASCPTASCASSLRAESKSVRGCATRKIMQTGLPGIVIAASSTTGARRQPASLIEGPQWMKDSSAIDSQTQAVSSITALQTYHSESRASIMHRLDNRDCMRLADPFRPLVSTCGRRRDYEPVEVLPPGKINNRVHLAYPFLQRGQTLLPARAPPWQSSPYRVRRRPRWSTRR